jgi:hypothetical protein
MGVMCIIDKGENKTSKSRKKSWHIVIFSYEVNL